MLPNLGALGITTSARDGDDGDGEEAEKRAVRAAATNSVGTSWSSPSSDTGHYAYCINKFEGPLAYKVDVYRYEKRGTDGVSTFGTLYVPKESRSGVNTAEYTNSKSFEISRLVISRHDSGVGEGRREGLRIYLYGKPIGVGARQDTNVPAPLIPWAQVFLRPRPLDETKLTCSNEKYPVRSKGRSLPSFSKTCKQQMRAWCNDTSNYDFLVTTMPFSDARAFGLPDDHSGEQFEAELRKYRERLYSYEHAMQMASVVGSANDWNRGKRVFVDGALLANIKGAIYNAFAKDATLCRATASGEQLFEREWSKEECGNLGGSASRELLWWIMYLNQSKKWTDLSTAEANVPRDQPEPPCPETSTLR